MQTTISPPMSLFSNALFSTLCTLSLLLLFYFPYTNFLGIFLFPLLISTSILLFLLRLGTSQQQPSNTQRNVSPHGVETGIHSEPGSALPKPFVLHDGINKQEQEADVDPRPKPEPGPLMASNLICAKTFVGWEVGAPLEVIYEGEEEGEGEVNGAFPNECMGRIERYPSLWRYYPESDSDLDSDSECSSSCQGDFLGEDLWDGVEERDELIEIALDYYNADNRMKKKKKTVNEVRHLDHDDAEDNLIEINIFPTRRYVSHN